MAYLKPPALVTKVMNPIVMRLGMSNSATLVVRGRKSGNEHPIRSFRSILEALSISSRLGVRPSGCAMRERRELS